jgi:23S rRNA (cytosine1962-C5)-methyltransferase
MKIERLYPKVIITRKGENSILVGHPWVYEGEVLKTLGNFNNGDLVDVLNEKEKYLGTGFINTISKIRVRLISRNINDTFDNDFFKRRIKYAWEYRKQTMSIDDLKCCRIIFGEADGFPGLTVDRFNDILVTQTLSLGIEQRKDIIFNALYQVLTEDHQEIKGLYERNDVGIREKEGLEENKGFYKLEGLEIPNYTTTMIIENDIKYLVDFENGQKTGFFLDQKYNRLAISKYTKNRTVLDCFTHTGSFAFNAMMGGAKKVVAVDISDTALEVAKKNAELNNVKIDFIEADVFEYLEKLELSKSKDFDFIILDPPAFTKSRTTVESAMHGYKEINKRAMRILPRGGYLVTCS